MLYSDAFDPIASSDVSDDIQYAISLLGKLSEITGIYRVPPGVLYDQPTICLSVNIDLSRYLPSRYTPNTHGILEKEPVILLFDADLYPAIAPRAGSNRQDFPWQGKPHVSIPGPQIPPLFCLSRLPLDDWFAVHGLPDLIDRIISWLLDAANGRLNPPEGRFEPTLYLSAGTLVFDYVSLASRILTERARSGITWRLAQFELLRDIFLKAPTKQLHMRFAGLVSQGVENHLAKLFASRTGSEATWGFPGILCWAPPGQQSAETFSLLPQTRRDLRDWLSSLGIDIDVQLDSVIKPFSGLPLQQNTRYALFPLLIAVERPTLLYGAETNIEILSLCILLDRKDQREVIFPLQHHHPLTPSRARYLSQSPTIDRPIVLLGAGALGSKIFSHWYRSGHVEWTIVDREVLLPHNPVRHALSASAVGQSKPKGLLQLVDGLFEGVRVTEQISLVEKDFHAALNEAGFRKRISKSIVLDATASQSVLAGLIQDANLRVGALARCAIVDDGQKAVVTMEGPNRNPRVDDVMAFLYNMGSHEPQVMDWLMHREQLDDTPTGPSGSDVELGLNCASDTLRLSDDVISFHAGQVSLRLKQWLSCSAHHTENVSASVDPGISGGKVGISDLSDGWREWRVPTVRVCASGGWSIRISSRAEQLMRKLMVEHSPLETGGILLGRIDYIRRIVYVVEAAHAPPDSQASEFSFLRGTAGIKELLAKINRQTGGMIGYVAEWHTHPVGPARPSKIDLNTLEATSNRFLPSPLPAVLIIVSPDSIHSHVKDPLS